MNKFLVFLTILLLLSNSVYSLSLDDIGDNIVNIFKGFFYFELTGTCTCNYNQHCDCNGDGNSDLCGVQTCNGVGSPCHYDSSCSPSCGSCDCSSCGGGGTCDVGTQSACASACKSNKYKSNDGTVSGHILTPDSNCWCSKSEFSVKCCECTCSGTWSSDGFTCIGSVSPPPSGCSLQSGQQCDCWTDSSCQTKCRSTPAGSCPECSAYCVFNNNPCLPGKIASCPYAYGNIECDSSLPSNCKCPSIDDVLESCRDYSYRSSWTQCGSDNDARSCSDIPECSISGYEITTLEGSSTCSGCNNPVKYKRCCHKPIGTTTTTTTSTSTTATTSTTTTTTINCEYLKIDGKNDKIVSVERGQIVIIESKVSDYGIIRYAGTEKPRSENLPRCSGHNCQNLVIGHGTITTSFTVPEDSNDFYVFETNAYESSQCEHLCSSGGMLYKNNDIGNCLSNSWTYYSSCNSECIKGLSVIIASTTTTTTTTTITSTTSTSTTSTFPTTTIQGKCPCYLGKSLYTGDYYYIFYYDCVDIVYKTSVDGVSWSERKIAAKNKDLTNPPDYFDIYFDGTYVHLAYQHTGSKLGFKRGLIIDNIISWEQTSLPDQGNTYYASKMSVVADSNGKPWITAKVYDSSSNKFKEILYYNNQQNGLGTWKKWVLYENNAVPFLVSLMNEKIYAFYYTSFKNDLRGRIYNSDGMISEDNIDILNGDFVLNYLSISSASNNKEYVYVAWLNKEKEIKFREKTISWSVPIKLADQQKLSSYPDITSNKTNNDAYVFWFNPENKLKLKERINGEWSKELKPSGDYFKNPMGETLRTFHNVMKTMIGESWCEEKSSKPYVHLFPNNEVLIFNKTFSEIYPTSTTTTTKTTSTTTSTTTTTTQEAKCKSYWECCECTGYRSYKRCYECVNGKCTNKIVVEKMWDSNKCP